MDGQMDCAFVVVVMHGAQDISRTTFRSLDAALRYMKNLREQKASNLSMTLYRTRVARLPYVTY